MDYKKKYNEAVKELGNFLALLKRNGVANDDGIIETNLVRIFPELRERDSEDERIRKRLITLIRVLDSLFFTGNNPSKEQCLAYLEKQKEQKPADRFEEAREKYQVEWSEEDEHRLKLIRQCIISCPSISGVDGHEVELLKFLDSLRPQSRKEIYLEAKHDLAIKFMNYLDENRPEGKMSLSNGECEDIDKAFKENDWKKIMRYANKYSWKPSEEQIHAIVEALKYLPNNKDEWMILNTLADVLRKLM